MQLTENFFLSEFVVSDVAARKNIDNTPNEEQIENLKLLCEKVLQPLCVLINRPIHITSGFRCVSLNKAVGGAKTSEHLGGMAADIWADGYETRELFDFIRKNFVGYSQCIEEYGQWVHISYNKTNIKNQDLLAVKINGRTKYLSV